MPKYRLIEGGLQDKFLRSMAKMQFMGGGFANGKTAAVCIKTLNIIKDYPNCNILMARSTYPKLNDTLRKEFFKWCPKDWIKSFSKTDNVLILKNGATINFRYIAQQGKSGESTTSNLLSATYDLIVVDQIEDPEITHKDFLDLLGRLRGMALYIGDDPTMPRTGPRWIIITSNPTRNWVYRKLVKPYHEWFRYNRRSPDLLWDDDANRPMLEIFEGSTYENKDNLEPDFIKTLEASYTGQMRERFLLGEWAAYEGLVYPNFDEAVHVIDHFAMESYFWQLLEDDIDVSILEGYDFGMAVPACYMIGFTDHFHNVFLMDGFYQAEMEHKDQVKGIKAFREQYNVDPTNKVLADPSIFRRSGQKGVGKTTAEMFRVEGIPMERGNNDILNGIVKVKQYMLPQKFHLHPIEGYGGAPHLYVSTNCQFLVNEINDYYWAKDTSGEVEDKPKDKNDHACDVLRYMLSKRPGIAKFIKRPKQKPVGVTSWTEMNNTENRKKHRYG